MVNIVSSESGGREIHRFVEYSKPPSINLSPEKDTSLLRPPPLFLASISYIYISTRPLYRGS